MKQEEPEPEVEGISDTWSGLKDVGKKELVSRQIMKVLDYGSKEFSDGTATRTSLDGSVSTIYTENEKKQFINAVDMLRIMLFPDLKKFTKDLKGEVEEIEATYHKLMVDDLQKEVNELTENVKDIRERNAAIQKAFDLADTRLIELYKRKLLPVLMIVIDKSGIWGTKNVGV